MKTNFLGFLQKLVLMSSILLATNAFAKYQLGVVCNDELNQTKFMAMDIYPGQGHVFRFSGTHNDLPAGHSKFQFERTFERVKPELKEVSSSRAELVFSSEAPQLVFEDNSTFGMVKNLVVTNLMPEVAFSRQGPNKVKVVLTVGDQTEGVDKVLEFDKCQLLLGVERESFESAFSAE